LICYGVSSGNLPAKYVFLNLDDLGSIVTSR
jgi:hypothetical protein